jgi:hypothetical protein
MRRRFPWVLTAVLIFAVASCAPSANDAINTARPSGTSAGFLLGLWHGLIIVVTFVVSLFNHSIGIYEVHNTGWSYNLGFVLGVMSAFGGAGAGAKQKKRPA